MPTPTNDAAAAPFLKQTSSNSTTRSNGPPLSTPRWWTAEFMVYFAIIIGVLWWMTAVALDMGSPSFPNYEAYSFHLEPGWLFGRHIDNSDLQYRGFRDKIPILLALAIGHVAIGRVLRAILAEERGATGSKGSRKRGEIASKISLTSSLIVMMVLHGAGIIKMLVMLALPYVVTRRLTEMTARLQKQHYSPTQSQSGTSWLVSAPSLPYGPAVVWAWGIFALFANSYYGGDQWKGMMPRWYNSFNFQVLHMISYSMDHYWAIQSSPGMQADEVHDKNARSPKSTILDSKEPGGGSSSNGTPSAKSRIDEHRRMSEYGMIYYLDYCLYLPLYFAGPIITFNDYASQLSNRGPIWTWKTVTYALRWVWSLGKAWAGLTPFQFMVMGYFNLQFIWLKVSPCDMALFFRSVWAMLDGIDTVENMEDAYTNYSAAAFWRSWHRSYNRWIIRYIYVPFAWGWLVVIFILPEILITQYFKKPAWQNWPYFRHFCGIGCVMNILLMMLVNLIGFAVGLEGAQALLTSYFTWKGLVFFSMAFPTLFALNQVQFEVRAKEQRQGKIAGDNIRY
ncbi:MBOAT, membrane-bound O-acyltransferase family-domain-containing protein [Chytridium lagenaria]|nr:MBOAT, membrane-bound O-acyltransferase family-domain-containing protein [Chytridium lagenaria]